MHDAPRTAFKAFGATVQHNSGGQGWFGEAVYPRAFHSSVAFDRVGLKNKFGLAVLHAVEAMVHLDA